MEPARQEADHPSKPGRGIQRLLIVRLSAMGDVIHALPAATALRRAFPEANIGWVIEERWAELLCTLPTPRAGARSSARPLVDHIHPVNFARWRKALLSNQTLEQVAAGLSDLRAGQYEVAVDLQGAARSALIARWSGAREIFGPAEPRENIASMFYTRPVITTGKHVVEQNLELAEAVAGQDLGMPRPDLPSDAAAEKECDHWLKERHIERFAILNPGAGWGAKQWPAERYGYVARHLAENGVHSLINYGPGEQILMQAVEASSGGAAEGALCSLTQLIALTRRASLFIGGDTGPMHLAAALGIPVVALFGPTDPARNGPYGTESIVLRSAASETSHARRSAPDEGLLQITSDEVVAAARKLLRISRG